MTFNVRHVPKCYPLFAELLDCNNVHDSALGFGRRPSVLNSQIFGNWLCCVQQVKICFIGHLGRSVLQPRSNGQNPRDEL